jgi:hypothetical protein
MKTLLWLDDIRNPLEDDWLVFSPIENPKVFWVKSYQEFTDWIIDNGLPDGICFDHDLGLPNHFSRINNGISKRQSRKQKIQEKTGYDCAKWLVDYCMDYNKPLPLYNIQSANPVGKDNINGLLKSFLKNYPPRK